MARSVAKISSFSPLHFLQCSAVIRKWDQNHKNVISSQFIRKRQILPGPMYWTYTTFLAYKIFCTSVPKNGRVISHTACLLPTTLNTEQVKPRKKHCRIGLNKDSLIFLYLIVSCVCSYTKHVLLTTGSFVLFYCLAKKGLLSICWQ